jgi:hypothetical protein
MDFFTLACEKASRAMTVRSTVNFRLLLLWVSLTVASAVQAEDRAVFEIKRAAFELDGTLLMLDARIDIELPEYIEMAVDQGFAVPVSFDVEIMQAREYWFDRKIVSLKQQYILHFLPMLNSYVITDINRSSRTYFDSREEAVSSLQSVSDYPMFDIGNIDAGLKVYARMRFGLNSDELPLPLKSSSLWANDWDLQSDWFSWDLDRVGR